MTDDMLRGLRTADIEVASRRAAEGLAAAARRRGLVDVAVGAVDSPLGRVTLFVTRTGLVRIAYPDERLDHVFEEVADVVSPRVLEDPRGTERARRQLDAYFEGRLRDFSVPIDWAFVPQGFFRRCSRPRPGSRSARSRRTAWLRGRREPSRCPRRGERPSREPGADRRPVPPRRPGQRRHRPVRRRGVAEGVAPAPGKRDPCLTYPVAAAMIGHMRPRLVAVAVALLALIATGCSDSPTVQDEGLGRAGRRARDPGVPGAVFRPRRRLGRGRRGRRGHVPGRSPRSPPPPRRGRRDHRPRRLGGPAPGEVRRRGGLRRGRTGPLDGR